MEISIKHLRRGLSLLPGSADRRWGGVGGGGKQEEGAHVGDKAESLKSVICICKDVQRSFEEERNVSLLSLLYICLVQNA